MRASMCAVGRRVPPCGGTMLYNVIAESPQPGSRATCGRRRLCAITIDTEATGSIRCTAWRRLPCCTESH